MRRRAALVAFLCSSPALAAEPLDGGEGATPTVRPTALLQIDATGADDDVRAFDTFNVRRARLGLAGELSPRLAYAVNFELGGAVGDPRGRLNNLWVEYAATAPLRIRAGLLAPSQPLEGSSSQLLFLERAAPSSIQRGLAGGSSALGVAAFANGRRWTASAGLAGSSVYGSPGRNPLAANLRWSILARGAEPLVHVGINATAGLRSENRRVRFSERGETRAWTQALRVRPDRHV